MMEKLEKCTKRIQNKKATVLSPIAFSIEEANKEIDLAEQELSEGKGIRIVDKPPINSNTLFDKI